MRKGLIEANLIILDDRVCSQYSVEPSPGTVTNRIVQKKNMKREHFTKGTLKCYTIEIFFQYRGRKTEVAE